MRSISINHLFIRIAFLVCFCAFFLFSFECIDHTLVVSPTITGYTETDIYGKILSNDVDDWRIRNDYRAKISISPAYPNPYSGSISFDFDTNFPDRSTFSLLIYMQTSPSDPQKLVSIIKSIPPFGILSHKIDFNTITNSPLSSNQLIRLFIYDDSNILVSYGDIMIK